MTPPTLLSAIAEALSAHLLSSDPTQPVSPAVTAALAHASPDEMTAMASRMLDLLKSDPAALTRARALSARRGAVTRAATRRARPTRS